MLRVQRIERVAAVHRDIKVAVMPRREPPAAACRWRSGCRFENFCPGVSALNFQMPPCSSSSGTDPGPSRLSADPATRTHWRADRRSRRRCRCCRTRCPCPGARAGSRRSGSRRRSLRPAPDGLSSPGAILKRSIEVGVAKYRYPLRSRMPVAPLVPNFSWMSILPSPFVSRRPRMKPG